MGNQVINIYVQIQRSLGFQYIYYNTHLDCVKYLMTVKQMSLTIIFLRYENNNIAVYSFPGRLLVVPPPSGTRSTADPADGGKLTRLFSLSVQ